MRASLAPLQVKSLSKGGGRGGYVPPGGPANALSGRYYYASSEQVQQRHSQSSSSSSQLGGRYSQPLQHQTEVAMDPPMGQFSQEARGGAGYGSSSSSSASSSANSNLENEGAWKRNLSSDEQAFVAAQESHNREMLRGNAGSNPHKEFSGLPSSSSSVSLAEVEALQGQLKVVRAKNSQLEEELFQLKLEMACRVVEERHILSKSASVSSNLSQAPEPPPQLGVATSASFSSSTTTASSFSGNAFLNHEERSKIEELQTIIAFKERDLQEAQAIIRKNSAQLARGGGSSSSSSLSSHQPHGSGSRKAEEEENAAADRDDYASSSIYRIILEESFHDVLVLLEYDRTMASPGGGEPSFPARSGGGPVNATTASTLYTALVVEKPPRQSTLSPVLLPLLLRYLRSGVSDPRVVAASARVIATLADAVPEFCELCADSGELAHNVCALLVEPPPATRTLRERQEVERAVVRLAHGVLYGALTAGARTSSKLVSSRSPTTGAAPLDAMFSCGVLSTLVASFASRPRPSGSRGGKSGTRVMMTRGAQEEEEEGDDDDVNGIGEEGARMDMMVVEDQEGDVLDMTLVDAVSDLVDMLSGGLQNEEARRLLPTLARWPKDASSRRALPSPLLSRPVWNDMVITASSAREGREVEEAVGRMKRRFRACLLVLAIHHAAGARLLLSSGILHAVLDGLELSQRMGVGDGFVEDELGGTLGALCLHILNKLLEIADFSSAPGGEILQLVVRPGNNNAGSAAAMESTSLEMEEEDLHGTASAVLSQEEVERLLVALAGIRESTMDLLLCSMAHKVYEVLEGEMTSLGGATY